MDVKNMSQEFMNWFAGIGFKLAIIVILTITALIIVRMITRRFVKIYVDRQSSDVEMQKRAETLGRMFYYFLILTVSSVSLMLVLDLFGVKLGPLLAAAGVVGVAIGFGTQHLVQDLLNGFFIMLDDEIRVGDVVEVAGISGMVERVTFRQTVLRSLNGNVHFVPNSKIDIVTNMTKSYSYCVLDIGVAYKENMEEVFSLMEKVSAEMQQVEPFSEYILEPLEILGLDQFADSALMIKARIKVQPIRQWKVKREFQLRLKQLFDEKGIEIPFPHLTLFMGQEKDGSATPLRFKQEQ